MPRISEAGKEKQNRGSGTGSKYKPYILAREINSTGTTANIVDWKHGRTVELLSQGEEMYYYIFRWDDDVEDINEQYKLDPKQTKQIARKLGFRHPPVAMTTDLLITYKNGTKKAVSVKYSKADIDFEFASTVKSKRKIERTLEKLTIEKMYWSELGVEWQLLFTSDVNIAYADNIRRVVEYYDENAVHDDISKIKHLIAIKELNIDMDKPIDYAALVRRLLTGGDYEIKIGDIIVMSDNLKFRIIYISDDVVLCQTETSKLNIITINLNKLVESLENDCFSLIVDTDNTLVNVDSLSEIARKDFEFKKQLVNEISDKYGPKFVSLVGKQSKPELTKIQEKYHITKSSLWRLIRHYLQSGARMSSLLKHQRKNIKYIYSFKTGNPGKFGISAGCIISEYDINAFSDALDYYKSGRAKSYKAAYDYMNNSFYSESIIQNGMFEKRLRSIDKRPSFYQFYYYCHKHITEEEKDQIKTSAMEQRNDKRLLLSEANYRVEFPGEKVECDAVEFDNALVSELNPAQAIGRPIIYVMRDVLTHAIVAFGIGFNNNSYLGLTSLMLNLGDNKTEYCKKYGIDIGDERLWPSNFIPKELYADRGSDFKSDGFSRVCNELNITRHLVTGGSGSLKGGVESWFHQAHSWTNPHTEDAGLIEKRFDSWHHREATLNLFEFTQITIASILLYNQTHMTNYKPRVAELQNNIDATPISLWTFYCSEKGSPRPIADYYSFLYSLLIPKQAKVTKRGIELLGLTYLNLSDKDLYHTMYSAQSRKKVFDIRYDPRDNSRIFYLDKDSRLQIAELNDNLSWQADIKGLTFAETDTYFKLKGINDRIALQRNDEISAFRANYIATIVSAAKEAHKGPNETKNMLESRDREKQLDNRRNAITDRLDNRPGKAITAPTVKKG